MVSQLDDCNTVMSTNDDGTLTFKNFIRADTFRIGFYKVFKIGNQQFVRIKELILKLFL